MLQLFLCCIFVSPNSNCRTLFCEYHDTLPIAIVLKTQALSEAWVGGDQKRKRPTFKSITVTRCQDIGQWSLPIRQPHGSPSLGIDRWIIFQNWSNFNWKIERIKQNNSAYDYSPVTTLKPAIQIRNSSEEKARIHKELFFNVARLTDFSRILSS